ncbi:hypothetical protein HanRHA438_Chr16g0787291 [Helianthus annuus]|uniref:Uncharacterized protein n=1 Tax=Helianthus annuus TaxID=4232 RepID=A0A251S3R0_HELAN|nr:hypothetical protein HanXRQr2_Chr16g0776521 [Helianthus annuus]KAJ0462537.1 hypothetical protein HanHA89_Chr16g0684461 [Helianthus annuus]KAJ0642935.1 hypothetical protein HanLR1_Chr16g0643871 [Helianthus annuus]KAJ0646799.1 hypothetical protein HanOQP8_Chr16g0639161 [Helianthus annuus]KAJ0823543.1 hypothetical protein HanPSC8_Chr16g0744961 [Helianthus annuus]
MVVHQRQEYNQPKLTTYVSYTSTTCPFTLHVLLHVRHLLFLSLNNPVQQVVSYRVFCFTFLCGYDALSFSVSMRMSSSCTDPTILQQLEQFLEDVIESDRVLSEKLNDLTVIVASIHKKQVELQISINVPYVRYKGQKDVKV